MSASGRPTRVAIVGGGCAAMAAAHALTAPELRGRFSVTVYQQGWRLGGKGASGRGPFGRIEEHGLHVWMGFYENAFRWMRSVYEELARDPKTHRIATWQDAFFPAPHVGLANWDPASDWTVWSAVFPPTPGLPGDPLGVGVGNPFTVLGYLARVAAGAATLFRVAWGPPEREPAHRAPHPLAELVRVGDAMLRTATGAATTAVGLLERLELAALLIRGAERTGDDASQPQALAVARALLEGILPGARRWAPREEKEQPRKRAAEVVEVLVASLIGTLRAGVVGNFKGFDILDDWDFGDWLRRHGASDEAVASPFVRGLYSLMFAFEDGDAARPRVAAGQMLRGCLRMFFTYRGAFFWKMRGGMGDVVFAPAYEVLRRRGVTFEFFHRLVDMGLDVEPSEAPHVARLRFLVQARPLGNRNYVPLVDVGGAPCWPSQPDWAQLEDGARHDVEARDYESFWDRRHVATKELRVGQDFDFVVLAVGLGEVPHVCREILERDPRWRRMTTHLKTVGTRALQIWSDRPLRELGWSRGSITMTGFAVPFDTWSDMTYLLDEEAWPAGRRPSSLAYFCNALEDDAIARAFPQDMGHNERALEIVRQSAAAFVERELPHLWPRLGPGGRGESEYCAANVNPTDRYTLCLPGTPQYRISPLDRAYDNLTIAGDWTSCGLNLGCVEAAVTSGLLAAHALSGLPELSSIVGYDHP